MKVKDILNIMWKRGNVKIISKKYDCTEYTVEILIKNKNIMDEEVKEIDVLKNDFGEAYLWINIVD